MKPITLVFISLLAISFQASAAAYKCTVNGQIVYQQLPCAESGEKMKIGGGEPEPAPASGDGGLRPGEQDLVREAELNQAARKGYVKIDMTPEQVRRAWGAPDKINRTVGTEFGVHEQWIYRRGRSHTQYIYLKNGKVTSWQD